MVVVVVAAVVVVGPPRTEGLELRYDVADDGDVDGTPGDLSAPRAGLFARPFVDASLLMDPRNVTPLLRRLPS